MPAYMGRNVNLLAEGYPCKPNPFDLCLSNEVGLWQWLSRYGGIEKVCCPGIKYVTGAPPWVTMPPQGEQFRKIGSIARPAVENTDEVVLQFRIPVGSDGVIVSVVNEWTGLGFAEASGDLNWRLQINRRWVQDYGNIVTTLGSLTTPCQIMRGGIRVYSDDLITYYVNLGTGALGRLSATGFVVCCVAGWWYPR